MSSLLKVTRNLEKWQNILNKRYIRKGYIWQKMLLKDVLLNPINTIFVKYILDFKVFC